MAAVCHGPAALVNWRGADGTSLFADKTVTGLSNAEEALIDGTGVSLIAHTRMVCNSFGLTCRMFHSL